VTTHASCGTGGLCEGPPEPAKGPRKQYIASACAAFFAALSFLCSPVDAAGDLERGELKGLSVSLVKIEAIDAAGHRWLGTGVGVTPEQVVTSCHVIRPAQSIQVQYRGLRRLVTAQLSDTEHDLCILMVPGLAAQSVRLGMSDALSIGEPVWAIGFEGGMALRARAGFVRALHAYDGARVVESTTPFTSGASGGALFDVQGRLVGILTYRLRGDRRSYFSVPVEWFVPRLTGNQAYAAVAPLEGAQPFWQRPQAGLPFFLRAHQLEASGDWGGLLNLTDQWSEAENTNAEAWVFRGRSLVETRDLAAAQLALQHAVALDPVSSTAWLQLGRLLAHRGLTEEAEDALAQLNRLNPELAQCLADEMRPARDAQEPHALDACSAL
jgi:serine protease Do